MPPRKTSKTPPARSKSSTQTTQPMRPVRGGEGAPPAKVRPPARKIGQRSEVIERPLSPTEVDHHAREALRFEREIERIQEEAKKIASSFKASITELRALRGKHVRAANTAKLAEEVTIEEWLDDHNKVTRIRADTRQQIGDRIATADELQEELELDPEEDTDRKLEQEGDSEAEPDDDALGGS